MIMVIIAAVPPGFTTSSINLAREKGYYRFGPRIKFLDRIETAEHLGKPTLYRE